MTTQVSALLGTAVVFGLPLLLALYLGLGERVLRMSGRWRLGLRIRPWWWLAPPLCLMGAILAYPLVDSIRLSLLGPSGTGSPGVDNYKWVFTSADSLSVLRNTLLWIILLPSVTLIVGVAVAVLADKVRYERLAKSVIVIPTAMSFVAGAAVWQIVYEFQAAGSRQTGLLNAIWVNVFGGRPKAWLVDSSTNNYALIVVGIWMYLGFAVLVLSAGVKGVPTDLIESARIDGAGEWQVFRYVILPGIRPAVAVVATTTLAWSLKIFDVVYVATGGRFGTDVIGTKVYEELFTYYDVGKGSALAVVLFIAVVPIMAFSARRLRHREGVR